MLIKDCYIRSIILSRTEKGQVAGRYGQCFWRYGYDMIFCPKWDIISYLISQKLPRYYIISYIPLLDIISDMIWKRYEKI